MNTHPLHVSVLAIPEAALSTLSGVYDVLNAFALLGKGMDLGVDPAAAPFHVEIVGQAAGPLTLASGLPIDVQRAVASVTATDIVIVPSFVLGPDGWRTGRYPDLVDWLGRMHAAGAALCSACSGVFLIAETGLFAGRDATVHYAYAEAFAGLFPDVPIHPERVLVVSGEREELVTSGASMTWHDMALYLIARHVGPAQARAIARLFALQWHQEGLAPFMVFEGRTDHGDAAIAAAQKWLETNFSVAAPIEEMVARSGMGARTFTRRFADAAGMAPLAYVQRLRIEDAKRRLESSAVSIDEISWRVGYEDPAFFRRLFKRVTGLTPGQYRKRFSAPAFANFLTADTPAAIPPRPVGVQNGLTKPARLAKTAAL